MSRQLKVAVIGAGPAGLVTARELQREGHEVVVFEKSDRIGGTWVYTPRVETDPLGLDPDREIVHSSLYYSLRTNLPRHVMGFSDYPFTIRNSDGELRDFPGHQEVLEFLNQFVRDFGLTEFIRFNHEVVRVEKEDDFWVVESRLSDKSCTEELFEAVVICNGHYTQPQLAEDIPGVQLWPGKQIHSHNYRVPDPFKDKVVVLIGAGPSAHDICHEIAQVAKEIHLTSRSPDIKVSKLDTFDNVWQHQEIAYCHENGEVAFKDGASIAADIILHCTGYKYDFPFLKPNGIVTIDDNRVGPLYKHVFPPEYAPRFSFVGLPHRVVIFLMLELQAKWVACALSGKVILPSKEEMLADVEEHYRLMEQDGVPKRYTQRLPVDPFGYLDWMAAQTGCTVSEQTKMVYYALIKYVSGTLWFGSFKDVNMESLLK